MTASGDRLLAHARRAAFNVDRERGAVRWLGATGTSMRPLVRPGTELLVEFGAAPRFGQIALFTDGDRIIAHRVVAGASRRQPGRLVAKGDGEPVCDAPVAPEALLGTVRALRHRERVTTSGCDGRLARTIARASRISGRITSGARRALQPVPPRARGPMVRAVSFCAQIPALTLAILARSGPTIEIIEGRR